jgi:hypothetical protein
MPGRHDALVLAPWRRKKQVSGAQVYAAAGQLGAWHTLRKIERSVAIQQPDGGNPNRDQIVAKCRTQSNNDELNVPMLSLARTSVWVPGMTGTIRAAPPIMTHEVGESRKLIAPCAVGSLAPEILAQA